MISPSSGGLDGYLTSDLPVELDGPRLTADERAALLTLHNELVVTGEAEWILGDE